MSNTTVTPLMGMQLPIPGVEVSPTWATELVTALTAVLDSHTHITGQGAKIPTAALLIDNDLAINHFNLLSVNSISLDNQLSVPPLSLPSTNNVLLSYNNDLYWQPSIGAAVKITNGYNLNNAAIDTNIWEQISVVGDLDIHDTDIFTYLLIDTTAAVNINLPPATTTGAGRYFIFKDVTGIASVNNITITPLGSEKIEGVSTTRLINNNFGSLIFVCNGVDGWNIFKDGHGLATSASEGVVKLTADLAGPSSTADAPMIVRASNTVWGTTRLTWDFGGSADAPRVVNISGTEGVSPVATVRGNTTLYFAPTAVAQFDTTAVLQMKSGSITTFEAGSALGINTASAVTATLGSGSVVTVASGGTLSALSGSIVSLDGATLANGTINATAITNGTIVGADISGGSVGAANGIATLDGTGKLTAAQRGGSVMDVQFIANSADFTTTSNSFVDTTYTLAMAALAGDVILIDYSVAAWAGTLTALGSFVIDVIDGGTPHLLNGSKSYFVAGNDFGYTGSPAYISKTVAYTVVNSGSITVTLQAATSTSTLHLNGYGSTSSSSSLRAVLQRL